MSSSVRRVALALAWIACAALLAFGSAGLVAGLTQEPSTAARAELTWGADEAIRPGLNAASADLKKLSADVEDLGLYGRVALAALVDRNARDLAVAIAEGSTLVEAIDGETGALSGRLATLPGVGPGMLGRLGPDMRVRYDRIAGALDTTAGLRESWVTLTAGSAAASRLAVLLADHDTYAAAAAKLGSGRSYPGALTQLDGADAALVEATKLRDALSNTADVTILDEWLTRNRNLDVALRDLYAALRDSKGKVTEEVRAAAAAEDAAQKRLPPDTRGLVIIMADIARGGLNQAVIGIEEAKGKLAAAVAALERMDAAPGAPGGAGSPAP